MSALGRLRNLGWSRRSPHCSTLHERRQEFSVPHLIEEILASRLLRAAAFDNWRPRETRRRYRFVADQARELARSGRPTLHDAVDYLERLASDPVYDAVARDDAGDESCVRVMTIHAAKGLEFPIVMVTGLGRKPRDRPQLIVSDRATGAVELRLSSGFETGDWKALNDREKVMQEAERVRMLYVALTRARDHLVVGLFRASKGEATDAAALDTRLRGRPDVDVVAIDWLPAAMMQRVLPNSPSCPQTNIVFRRRNGSAAARRCWRRFHRSARRPPLGLPMQTTRQD